jgi:hypothetical protein
MAETKAFQESLRKMCLVSRSFRIALMCSESEPLDCHRFLLIGRFLGSHNVSVRHILSDGRDESQREAETRLVVALGLDQPDMFAPGGDAVSAAYKIQESRIAYAVSSENSISDR